MMTTGYDCPDLLNVCLMRPIFSPTDFIQIKGRGTRKHNFVSDLLDKELSASISHPDKTKFKLFDFFANCEFFEEKFNYDEVLKLPLKPTKGKGDGTGGVDIDEYDSTKHDPLKTFKVAEIDERGMKIDRMYFDRFEETVKDDAEVQKMIEQRDLDAIEQYIVNNIFNKPEEFYNLEKLRESMKVDRRLTLREIIEKVFGFIPYFKSKDELMEAEFDKFDSRYLPDEKYLIMLKTTLKVILPILNSGK